MKVGEIEQEETELVSRLVEAESEIQLANDPSGETTQWVLPNQQTNSLMSNIRNVASRTMTNTRETISNLGDQIIQELEEEVEDSIPVYQIQTHHMIEKKNTQYQFKEYNNC